MVDVRPRELGDVDQAVHAVEVDERAEVDDVRDLALDDVARLQLVEDLLRCSLRSSSSTARRESTTLLRERLSSITFARSSWPRNSSRSCTRRISTATQAGTAHAEVEDQPALDDLDHAPVHRLARLGGALDVLPRELEARTLLREDQTPFGVLLREHERVDLVAEDDLVGRVDRAPDRELGDRDDALGLVADVDEHLVLVHADDRAVDDLPLVDLGKVDRSRGSARRRGLRPRRRAPAA